MFKRTASDSLLLYDKAPAKSWFEGYPIGNGSVGGMVYGRTDTEIIALNHDTLWSGYPRNNEYRGKGIPAFEKMKAAVRNGHYTLADKIHKDEFAGYSVSAYMPLGELKIEYLSEETERTHGYRRLLDLSKAVAVSRYKKGGRSFESLAFASHPDGVLVYKTTCANGSFDFKLSATSRLYSRAFFENGILRLEGECPISSEQAMSRTDRTTLYSDESEKRGVRFMAAFHVVTDGKGVSLGDSVRFTGATYFEIYTVIATSFNGYDTHPFLNGRDYKRECGEQLSKVKAKSFDEILKRHIADHRKLFCRVSLDLGSDRRASVTTEKRLIGYQSGVSDRALPTLIFNYGRYLTVAASRKGSQAMNLQGIWCNDFFPAWQSNYTVNVNTEMNYFPTLAVNLKEAYQPLISLIKELSEAGRLTAKMLYGADGWVCHHNTDLWRATQPTAGHSIFSFWNAAGGWLCRHLYEYYEYTLDVKFLKKTAYPIMKGAAEFYLSLLTDSKDGYRIIFPSTSPENAYITANGDTAAISETTEMTMSIVRELFGNILSSAALLGIDDEFTRRIDSEKKRLRPPVIGSDGRVLEWYREMPENDVHHRHPSHLYALYPGNEITPEKTPDLAEGYKKSLIARGVDGSGWSIIWKSALYARLYDGENALKQLKALINLSKTYRVSMTGGGMYSSLLCAHPPFQIDGNFGATAAVCEMLMQSTVSEIRLLPALPSEWDTLTVKGLCAKGRREVSMTVKNGVLTECTIKGTLPERVLVGSEDITKKFTFDNGRFIYVG